MSQPKDFISKTAEFSTRRRIGFALAGALVFRLPYWIFQLWVARLQSLWPWQGDQHTWCIWDCGIYTQLSQDYTAAHSAFFPLFPLLIRDAHGVLATLGLDLGPNGAALLVSNVFTLLAGVLFLFYAEKLWPRTSQAPKVICGFFYKSWLALLFLSIFPEGHFWMRGYGEAVFFALLVAILLSFQNKKWLLGGVFCGLIAISRPPGLWAASACGVYLISRLFSRERTERAQIIAGILACAVPFLGFMAWLWVKTGNPVYFYSAQASGWGRHFDLLAGLKDHLPRWDAAHLYLYFGLFAALRFFRRRSGDWLLLGAITLMLTDLPIYFGGFYSYVRFASASPGIFLTAAELGEESPWGTLALVTWCLVRLGIQMHQSISVWVG